MKSTLPDRSFRRAVLGAVLACAVLFGPAGGHSLADLVLVVADSTLEAAMQDWAALRRGQGHRLRFVEPAAFAASPDAWASSKQPGERLVLLLVGDGQSSGVEPAAAPAQVVRRYGPETEIASDAPLAAAAGAEVVARLPFNHPDDLHGYLARVVRREASPGTWNDLRLQLAAGVGGFSPLIDSAIEQVAANLLKRLAPIDATMSLRRYGLTPTDESPTAPAASPRGGYWVWMGHGWRDGLPGVADPSLASVCGGADVAVLLACYAGDFAAPGRCVAERLLDAPDGPLAVVAATRVTMPYGNTRFGAELLLGLRGETRPAIGELFATARERSVSAAPPVELEGLEQLATLVGAEGTLLPAERQDHAIAYHLLGDPLVELRRAMPLRIEAPPRIAGDEVVTIAGVAPFAGRLRVELAKPGRPGDEIPFFVKQVDQGEHFRIEAPTPRGWRTGERRLRVGVEGARGLAVASATITRGPVGERVAAAPTAVR